MPKGQGAHFVEWVGLPLLEAQLKALPKDLADEALPILLEFGQRTATAIALAYHRRSGRLAGGVSARVERGGGYGPRARVVSAAPHAHLYERGTDLRFLRLNARHKAGWRPADKPTTRVPMGGVFRGAMPANPTFVPRMQAARRALEPVLKELMRSHGLTVTGSDVG
jgi:hypothetical protein